MSKQVTIAYWFTFSDLFDFAWIQRNKFLGGIPLILIPILYSTLFLSVLSVNLFDIIPVYVTPAYKHEIST